MLLNQKVSKEILAAYHLQKVSGKFGRKVTGTRLFGSFRTTISGRRVDWKGGPVFPVWMFQTEIRVPFLQKPVSDFSGRISVNVTD